MQEAQARIQSLQAKAQADQGLSVERSSRVEENKALAVEREAKAQMDEQTGILNMVKALKEIDEIDLTHVEKLINLSALLKQHQQQDNAEFYDQNVSLSQPAFNENYMQEQTGYEPQIPQPQETPYAPMSASENN